MYVANDEYGAPWNDQYYIVTIADEDGKQWDEKMVLSGPRNYDDDELFDFAEGCFYGYSIIAIRPNEICR